MAASLPPSFPDVSSFFPRSFSDEDAEGLILRGIDVPEAEIQRSDNEQCSASVRSWKEHSNGDIETGIAEFPVAIQLGVGDKASNEQGLRDLSARLLPALLSLPTCREVIQITAAKAFDILYRAAVFGGCYGSSAVSESEALTRAWITMFALAGIQFTGLPSDKASGSFLPEDYSPPVGITLPLSLLCRRALYEGDQVVDEELAQFLETHSVPARFSKPGDVSQQALWEFFLCALSLESCLWFSYNSEWHEALDKAWQVGLVCIAPSRQRFSCLAVVDTD